jgi:alkylation response protein AidB-like acyl-CoA dehydrogenase
MDFQTTEEQKLLKVSLRPFLEREIAPAAQERDSRGPLTRDEAIDFIKKLIPYGYYSGGLPPEFGGSGLDNKTVGLLTEELARVWAGLAGLVWLAGGSGAVAAADEARREELAERFRAGEAIGAGAISEPNVGSDASSIETTATEDGDDWVLNGTKAWISNGPVCDHVLVATQTDKTAGRAGVRWVLVEQDVSPYATSRVNHLLGLRAWSNGELTFQDCRVPRQNVGMRGLGGLTDERRPWAFETPRSMLAIISTGIAQGATDASISYAQGRQQFGRPIARFQMVQEMIADMVIETEAARLLAYQALDLLDRAEECTWQAAAAKAYATEMAVRITSKAIEVHGAVGLSEDLPIERYFRDARAMTIPDGTTEIQKLIIGRVKTGISAFT